MLAGENRTNIEALCLFVHFVLAKLLLKCIQITTVDTVDKITRLCYMLYVICYITRLCYKTTQVIANTTDTHSNIKTTAMSKIWRMTRSLKSHAVAGPMNSWKQPFWLSCLTRVHNQCTSLGNSGPKRAWGIGNIIIHLITMVIMTSLPYFIVWEFCADFS